jgi:hypothetical protein
MIRYAVQYVKPFSQASFNNINQVKTSTPVEQYTNTEDTEQLVPEQKTKKG